MTIGVAGVLIGLKPRQRPQTLRCNTAGEKEEGNEKLTPNTFGVLFEPGKTEQRALPKAPRACIRCML